MQARDSNIAPCPTNLGYDLTVLFSINQDMLVNIFKPLFEVTLNPKSHPSLHAFLKHVTAFDSVDDESKVDAVHFDYGIPTPDAWSSNENPPYTYYIFYMFANLVTLNHLRT